MDICVMTFKEADDWKESDKDPNHLRPDNQLFSPLDTILPATPRNPLCGEGHYEICDDWNVEVQTRSLSPEEKINPEDKIVLCVGDSFTFCDGMYYKDTWTKHLQDSIYKDYKVINVGIRGASNTLITNILSKYCNKYGNQIENVICGFSFNARRTYFTSRTEESKLQQSTVNISPGHSWNPTNLRIVTKIQTAFETLNTEENDQSDFQRNLLLVKGLSKIHNMKVFWWTVQEWGDYDSWKYNKDYRETLESYDFTYMNITSHIDRIMKQNKITDEEMQISKEDGHMSKKGNWVMAEAMKRYLAFNKDNPPTDMVHYGID
jgi:hypothetical protein